MEKYYKLDVMETTATRIKADATQLVNKEGVDGYARAWLKLTNTVKDNKKDLFKLYNDYDNGIYITCAEDYHIVKATKEYLENLGLEIVAEETVLIVQPEEVFNDDMDVELINWE